MPSLNRCSAWTASWIGCLHFLLWVGQRLPFERDVLLSKVDSDERDADSVAGASFVLLVRHRPSLGRDRLKKAICSRKAKDRPTNYAYTIADHAFRDRVAVKQQQ